MQKSLANLESLLSEQSYYNQRDFPVGIGNYPNLARDLHLVPRWVSYFSKIKLQILEKYKIQI